MKWYRYRYNLDRNGKIYAAILIITAVGFTILTAYAASEELWGVPVWVLVLWGIWVGFFFLFALMYVEDITDEEPNYDLITCPFISKCHLSMYRFICRLPSFKTCSEYITRADKLKQNG